MDVVTFGETMILMTPTKQGSLDTVWEFQKGLAGAESNVAIALARARCNRPRGSVGLGPSVAGPGKACRSRC